MAASKNRAKERVERSRDEFAAADRLYWLQEFPEAPTPEELRRRAQRFGPEYVQEVADALGVDLTASTEARKPKRLTSTQQRRSLARVREALA